MLAGVRFVDKHAAEVALKQEKKAKKVRQFADMQLVRSPVLNLCDANSRPQTQYAAPKASFSPASTLLSMAG